MQPTPPEWASRPSLSKGELCEFLSISCYKTLDKVLARVGLTGISDTYPWRRIFRAVHGTEAALLPGYLAELKARCGTPEFLDTEDPDERASARAAAQGSTIIDGITDLERALKEPLWSFERMACELGKKPNTLSKALREGRVVLPIRAITLGPRLRLYLPLEVVLWRDDAILLDLPPALRLATTSPGGEEPAQATRKDGDTGPSRHEAANPSRHAEHELTQADAATQIEKALFGQNASNKATTSR